MNIYVRHSLYLIIWDPERHLGSSKLVSYVLSKNVKDRSEQSSALAYILYLYESYGSYILD